MCLKVFTFTWTWTTSLTFKNKFWNGLTNTNGLETNKLVFFKFNTAYINLEKLLAGSLLIKPWKKENVNAQFFSNNDA